MLNWYLQCGKDSDVVVSSRIRLARNFQNYHFPSKISTEESNIILQKLEEIVPSLGYGLKLIKLENIDDITKISLIEKHLISPEFAMQEKSNKAILINDDENICIMINEEDHLRLQVFIAGYELENLMKFAIEIDEKIGNITKTTVYYGNQGLQLALFTYFVTFAFFIPILTISLIYIIIYLIVKCKVKKKKCKQNINKESCEK